MKIKEIFDLAIEIGIDNDPRGRKKIEKILKKRQEEYKELPEKKKRDFDIDKLKNPYSDSGIHYGDPEREVKTILVGIDIGVEEILLVKELERRGTKIDLVFAHHPEGKALTNLHEVMDIQTDVLARAGVPENIAEGVLADRIREISRAVAPINHYKPVDAAKLLDVPLLNIHTPADNSVWNFVDKYISKKKPETVGEIIETLKEIPEYAEAVKLNAGPVIFTGSENLRAGKVVVSGMTGGTGGSEKIFERMSHYGIGTEIGMHIGEKHREEAAKHYINVVIAGHIASDSVGLNIIMDELEKRGIKIIACSGFLRHSRV
ncbi:MAG: glutamate synthase-related protein [Patescibacteria group bacterium]|nr:glutamate synthase-related protein [Patescibacteria group bacterium]